MHRVAYVHRDIKLENLLFAGENCEPETLRIADFGFARKMTSSRSTLSEQCGTPGYVAPEIITGQCYTPAVDCWAAGVVLYAAVVGRFPFDAGEDTQASFRMIAEGRVHEIPASSGVSDDAKDLIARLLTVDPVTRFTAEEALGHPWIVKHTSSANDGGDGGGADGYARADKTLKLKPGVFQALLVAQERARKSRAGMWEYGDVDSDDEEPSGGGGGGAWGRGRR